MEFLAKGKRGFVYVKEINEKKVVVKKENPESKAINRINHEAKFLQEVNELGIGPKYISHTEDELIMEFIEGKIIEEFVKENEKDKIVVIVKDVLKQCFKLDKIKISKEEMHHPYKHVIIGEKVVMIDWERAHKTLKPSNVTQFCQYLTSTRFGGLLKEKGININKNEIISLAKDYKEEMSVKNFNKIIGVLPVTRVLPESMTLQSSKNITHKTLQTADLPQTFRTKSSVRLKSLALKQGGKLK